VLFTVRGDRTVRLLRSVKTAWVPLPVERKSPGHISRGVPDRKLE